MHPETNRPRRIRRPVAGRLEAWLLLTALASALLTLAAWGPEQVWGAVTTLSLLGAFAVEYGAEP